MISMNSNYYKSTIKHSWLVMTTMAMMFSRPFVHASTTDGEQEQHRHLRSTTNSNNVPIITSYNVNDGTSRKLQEDQQQTTTAASCILITTGTGTYDGGYLDVYVNTGSGYEMVTIPGISYDKGQLVLDECYANLINVQVTNSQTNAWGGSIESSTDGNKVTYSPMECLDCTTGTTTEYIVVDGDDNGTGDTKCLNGSIGNVCTLVNVVTTGQPTPEVSVSL